MIRGTAWGALRVRGLGAGLGLSFAQRGAVRVGHAPVPRVQEKAYRARDALVVPVVGAGGAHGRLAVDTLAHVAV